MSAGGITLAQVATDAKSKEITAIPQVLKLIDVSGAVMIIDAVGGPDSDREGDHRSRLRCDRLPER
jgi:hypothetical protein